MSESAKSNTKKIEQQIQQLQNLIRQKNQIIYHLNLRIKNQQKQIDMLVTDAQDKHMHQISKYYAKTYDKYMKFGKYLLLRIDQVQTNGIYLPKYAKIVHFGEIQIYTNNREYRDNMDTIDSRDKKEKGKLQHTQSQNVNQKNIQNKNIKHEENIQQQQNFNPSEQQPQAQGLKQLNMNKKQSISFEASCKGLSAEILELKQKLRTYANMVNKTPIKMDNIKQQNSYFQKSPIQSIIINPTPNKIHEDQMPNPSQSNQKKINNNAQNVNKVQNQENQKQSGGQKIGNDVSKFPSPSPIKKRHNTKTIFIRKKG